MKYFAKVNEDREQSSLYQRKWGRWRFDLGSNGRVGNLKDKLKSDDDSIWTCVFRTWGFRSQASCPARRASLPSMGAGELLIRFSPTFPEAFTCCLRRRRWRRPSRGCSSGWKSFAA
ncbi:Hypothetical predicted protein [Lynx pardinus]|uniref:Uncharacterized protein n=1 Tax=Lynx pardinus TaxID=191816 RepID=A0A485NLC7_LYNPA|nr:Hypothetical predicted protein [Lynx pardinus]